MKTKAILCCGIALLAIASWAQAAVLYWDGTTSAGAVSVGVVDGQGKWTSASVFPDGWSASTAVSTVRNNVSPYTRTKAAYNTTSGQAAFAEIEFYLTGVGYWEIAATNPAASLGVGAVKVTGLSGWVGLPASTSIFSTGNAWNTMGTFQSTTTTPKIRFDEDSKTTNRWYLDQMRLTSATPGAPTGGTVAGGTTNVPLTGALNDLSWTAGNYSSFFDVFLSTDGGASWGAGQHVTGTTYDPDSYPLLPSQTYTWKVVAGNVDMSTTANFGTFVTAPEPATMAFLALGGLLLRRRRA